jgi:cytochrome c oxidase cbb3-type subunit 3
MHNILKTFLVLTFVAFGAFVFSTGAKANFNRANSFAENDADTKTLPKDLYVRNCARCHGADGKGETEVGRNLDVPNLSISGSRMSAAKISRIISGGKDDMPAFGKKLNKTQIASISAYVRKL